MTIQKGKFYLIEFNISEDSTDRIKCVAKCIDIIDMKESVIRYTAATFKTYRGEVKLWIDQFGSMSNSDIVVMQKITNPSMKDTSVRFTDDDHYVKKVRNHLKMYTVDFI